MTHQEISIYPTEQYMHHHHPTLRKFIEPDVPVVQNGRIVDWRPPEALHQALTAIQDRRNRHTVDQIRRKTYLRSIYRAASTFDLHAMRETVSAFPDMVPQSQEIMGLPDRSFRDAAMIMTLMLE